MPEVVTSADSLVGLVRDAVRTHKLPFTPGGIWLQRGVNQRRGSHGELPPALRDWRRNASSLSVARHLQHLAMWRFVDDVGPHFQRNARCLDWDGWYVGSIFASLCAQKDVVEFSPPPHRRVAPRQLRWRAEGVGALATRWYLADAHNISRTLPHAAYDLIIANSVFEHLRSPFVAMRELALLLRPGGLLFWHTPFEYEFHGVPHDYFRYTVSGARAIAEDAGLVVDRADRDGGYTAVLSNVLGLASHHWTVAELAQRRARAQPTEHYLATIMVAHKPVANP